MLDSLIKALVYRTDCAGIAHLSRKRKDFFDPKKTDPPLLFRQYGADDYSYQKCGDTLTDARDKQKYATVCLGKQNWMAQNLNYNAPGSITYDNDSANGPIYGRLYNIKTIMQGASSSEANPSGVTGICPKGWHVPSSAEFVTLFEAVGFNTAGGALKAKILWDAPNTGATNSSGFTGLPGESAGDIATPGSFGNLGKRGYFATTTNEDDEWVIYLLVNDGSDIQGTNVPFEKQCVSCRCLKD